jgi:hypothetical protein
MTSTDGHDPDDAAPHSAEPHVGSFTNKLNRLRAAVLGASARGGDSWGCGTTPFCVGMPNAADG